MHQPTITHWYTLKRLLHFIKGTLHHGLSFDTNFSLDVQCYAYSDWGGDPDDQRLTTGYAIFLENSLISWQSKNQPTIARSSTKSEYKSITNTTTEFL